MGQDDWYLVKDIFLDTPKYLSSTVIQNYANNMKDVGWPILPEISKGILSEKMYDLTHFSCISSFLFVSLVSRE